MSTRRLLAVVAAGSLASAGAARGGSGTILPLAGAPTYAAAAARRAALRPWAAAARGAAPAAGATMTASPAAPTNSIANVTVSWAGVANAASTDWVAVYCVGAPLDAWQQWTYVTASPGYASGSGTLSFTLFRAGCDNEFRYYRDPSPYTFVVASNAVRWPGDANGPYHLHAAFGDDPATSLTLSWTTPPGAPPAPAVLQVGTAPGAYDLPNVTAQRSVSYAATDCCTAPATTVGPDHWQDPGTFHHATVTGLAPATTYYLRPTAGGVAGAETAVRTGAARAAGARTRFVVYGDMATSAAPGAVDTSARVTARLDAGEQLDFLAHVGDLSYGEGNVAIWNLWMSYIEPYASRLPYAVSIGNHEYDYEGPSSRDPSGAGRMWSPSFWNGGVDSQGECGVGTDRRFRMPASGSSNGVFWHSFSVGNVHVAMISSEHDPSPGSPMGTWLAADLAAVDRALTPWLFVGIHRPLVETEQYPSDYAVANGLRGILEPLLLEQKVDAVLAGHYHSFMRTCQVANLKCTPGAPVHYTTGAAGASLDNAPLYQSDYVEKYDGDHYGYSIIDAVNATHCRLMWFWNSDDSLQDDVWIVKA